MTEALTLPTNLDDLEARQFNVGHDYSVPKNFFRFSTARRPRRWFDS